MNLHSIIHQIYESLRSLSEGRRITVQLQLVGEVPLLNVNPEIFGRALRHLLQNAITYSDDGGQVNIITSTTPTHVILKVCDNGVGISEVDLPYIFDRFYRADTARSGETGGSGLGLAIAKRTVELYGGIITVDSIVGQGTTFTMKLPRSTIAPRLTTSDPCVSHSSNHRTYPL